MAQANGFCTFDSGVVGILVSCATDGAAAADLQVPFEFVVLSGKGIGG
jgi:hypothetical protein